MATAGDFAIDPNKVTAYIVIELAKSALSAIEGKIKAGKKLEEVEGWIEIDKLKPWKGLEKERAVLILLPVYPGLIDIFQNKNLCQELLLLDAGGGLLFCRPTIKKYLDSSRTSHVSGTIKEVQSAFEVLKRGFLEGSYNYSLKSLFDQISPNLDTDFAQLVNYKFNEIHGMVDREKVEDFLHLQIGATEYNARLQMIFRSMASAASETVALVLKFLNKLGSDKQVQYRDKILQASSSGINSLQTLRTLCDKHNNSESFRLDEAILKLKDIERTFGNLQSSN